VDYGVEKRTLKKHRFEKKKTFPFLYTWELVKHISIWNYPKNNL
jgi:hypothetical protein